MANEERVTPAPVDLAAVEAVANAANDSRPWLDASDLDDHPSATAEHIAYCSPARVLALTKALRIAESALSGLNIVGYQRAGEALRALSALVVIR